MLEAVQRRATKQLPAYGNMTYEDRLRRLNLPSLAYRRLRGDAIETFKIATGKYDYLSPIMSTLEVTISNFMQIKLLPEEDVG